MTQSPGQQGRQQEKGRETKMKDNQLKDSDDQSFNEPDFLQPGPKTGSEGLGDLGQMASSGRLFLG